jgi:hypothetical protein
MRRVDGLLVLGLLCVLSQERALGDEAPTANSAVDDRVKSAQATGPIPVSPPLSPGSAPRANATTPGPPLSSTPRSTSPPIGSVRPPGAISGLASASRPATRTSEAVEAPSAGLTSLRSFGGGGVPLMLGDLAPAFGPSVLQAPGSRPGAVQVPWARGYKMADNQSPRPQDRVFVAFNFFDDLGQPAASGLHQVKIYREFFGAEKTFFDGNASIGLRIPLNTISAQSFTPGLGGTSTSLGDLTVFLKGIFWQNRSTGSLLSGGLAITTPNGPSGFAGASFAKSVPATSLQPFFGYIFNFGDWFVQGFTGSNIPTDPRVAAMYYNDVGLGYFLYRAADPDAWLSAVVPTFEVHVNTPLSHRSRQPFVGAPDVVDLTFGSSFGLGRWGVLSAGVVNPVTGPRPYELEAVVLLNIFFGRSRVPPTPPPVL